MVYNKYSNLSQQTKRAQNVNTKQKSSIFCLLQVFSWRRNIKMYAFFSKSMLKKSICFVFELFQFSFPSTCVKYFAEFVEICNFTFFEKSECFSVPFLMSLSKSARIATFNAALVHFLIYKNILNLSEIGRVLSKITQY